MAEMIYDGRRLATRAAIVAVVGFVVLAIGLVVDPARTWLSYLTAFAFAFTIAVGALILLMIGYAANARWMAVVRRATEVVALPLPALAVLFVPILFGLAWLYPWHTPPAGMSEHDLAVLDHRRPFLNTPAFVVRVVLYFAIFIIASFLLRRWSRRRDGNGAAPIDPVAALSRERAFASAMLPPVGLAFSFAVIDWLMTLHPLWSTTMFPVTLFAGGFLTAIAVVTLVSARLHARGAPGLTTSHFYALGRMLFAFTVFWAYAAFFQAMLTKIANKPEEVTFYALRFHGAWLGFVWVLVIGHFALPFLFLLPRAWKFSPRAMTVASWWLVVMHLVDIYWIVIPSQVQGLLVVHWLDLGAFAAVLGTCVAVAARRQHGVAWMPTEDPFFADGAAYRSPL